jgi:hypothetical protein
MAIDQGTGEVYVIDAGSPPSVKRYNANGTASNFSALASNAIDGAGGADTTPQGSLSFGTATRVQIALDESGTATDGDIYVAQASTKLVDVFDSTGTYKGQLTESSEGLLGEICGVAVDSAGALYLGDIGGKVRKYVPAANPPVNGDNTANFATVASPCQIAAGTGATAGFIFVNRSTGELLKVDSATGEVKYTLGSVTHRTVYVNPASGHVYAPRQTGESSEVVEYDASGAGSATTVSAFKPGSTIEGVAVRESSGDVYLTRSGQTKVQVYGPTVTQPDVTTTAATNNTGTRATLNGTVNPDGVELSECKFEWSESSGSFGNTAPCAESNATIGSGTSPVAVHADLTGLAPQGTNYKYRLVAKNAESPAVTGSQQDFTTPTTVTATAASGITTTTATLNGTVNPDTATISGCVFEWGTPKGPGEVNQKFPNTAPCVPGPGGITGTSPVAVSAGISGLEIGSTYVYRLKATYPTGAVITGQKTLQTLGPVIAASWSEGVIYEEAVLRAQINPAGKATTYRFEYGTSEAYGSETEELSVGSDSSVHLLTRPLEGLTEGTTYHYRVVATNADAENIGPDQTFTTFERQTLDTDCPNQDFRVGPGAKLPECRAYEMVTPVDKDGIDILPQFFAADQAALDGDKFAFTTWAPFGDAQLSLYNNQFIASRGASGWTSHGINLPHEANVKPFYDISFQPGRFSAFSEDLSTGFLYDDALPALDPAALPYPYYNHYLWHAADESVEPLTTELFGAGDSGLGGMGFQGYSADASHVLFSAAAPLTPDAGNNKKPQVYDYHDGELELVSVLPGGGAATNAWAGNASGQIASFNPEYNGESGETRNAISDDGSRIFWMKDYVENRHTGRLYVRVDGETTIPISESVSAAADAAYWMAAADGSQAIFSAGAPGGLSFEFNSLYRFDVDSETPTLIANQVSFANGVLGVSEDASRVYFISNEALLPGAVEGEPNLYLDDEGTKTFIATLFSGDGGPYGNVGDVAPTASNGSGHNSNEISLDFSEVSAGGELAVFQSRASLTGYDNTSLVTGKPAIEIYAYDANADQIYCVSCNPSGGRPHTGGLPQETHLYEGGFPPDESIRVAAWLPTPSRTTQIPRMLAEDGSHVFFNSFDPLVPHDTNGVEDVYQWVAPGVDGCGEDDGCVRLISTGQDPGRSVFIDASENGRDVFFRTAANIDADDEELIDIYDARVGGGFPHTAEGAGCLGDACQSVPEPPVAPTPASAATRGPGDPVPVGNCSRQARRAAQLSRRAKTLRKRAKRVGAPKRTSALRKRADAYSKRAKALSKRASRCRRANRRASR